MNGKTVSSAPYQCLVAALIFHAVCKQYGLDRQPQLNRKRKRDDLVVGPRTRASRSSQDLAPVASRTRSLATTSQASTGAGVTRQVAALCAEVQELRAKVQDVGELRAEVRELRAAMESRAAREVKVEDP